MQKKKSKVPPFRKSRVICNNNFVLTLPSQFNALAYWLCTSVMFDMKCYHEWEVPTSQIIFKAESHIPTIIMNVSYFNHHAAFSKGISLQAATRTTKLNPTM